jgi:hypothetical protein
VLTFLSLLDASKLVSSMHKLIGILSFPRSSKREEAGVGDYSSNCLLSIDHFDPFSVLFKMEKV